MTKIQDLFRSLLLALLLIGTAACSYMRAYESLGQSMDDSMLTARMRARMAEDPRLHAFEISVDMQEGVVRLKGRVDTRRSADRAVQIARYVEGVRFVINDLTLK